ncbi:MAG: mismatch repair protein MutS protein [Parcubacteria group bacterium GW2011_GWA2_44_12]|nr:MAG: mismatch repair protein MutS protein [Parcubacteria group bacterium GW2011_GWA2_44_12]
MLKQYFEIKQQNPDAILFFRMGDFYEMFGSDAIEASKLLGIALTARGKGTANEIAMCGVPHHASENYIVKLTRAGKKVALCEQITPPWKGIVERKVTHIITPGTTLSSQILDEKSNNYIVAVHEKNGTFGFAIADIGTGEFQINQLADTRLLKEIIFRLAPKEIIGISQVLEQLNTIHVHLKNTLCTAFDPGFNFNPHSLFTKHFGVAHMRGFGIENMHEGVYAGGILFAYLKETQKTGLAHINSIKRYHYENFMLLDEATIRNLELLATMYEHTREGSVLNTIDYTKTAMGGRMLKHWLLHPLLSKEQIENRLDGVQFLKKHGDLRALQNSLGAIADIERILGKIGLERAHARDLLHLKYSLQAIVHLKTLLKNASNSETLPPALERIRTNLHEHNEVIDLIEKAIHEDPPIDLTQGNIIKDSYNQELDSLRDISRNAKEWLQKFAIREIGRTKIASLKVRFNKVFGYYIEISKANLAHVPNDYMRKQTLVNAERFITPELKEFEDTILNAEETMCSLEYSLFLEVRQTIAAHIQEIQKTARALAQLDVLAAFSALAAQNGYVKPEINERGKIEIEQGRHPVIEKLQKEAYIANNASIDNEIQQIILLTGPNMSGKSSYLRQIALITLLAHIGCFVPAKKANIGVVDRIFTRVGAEDNITRGQSTFMIEMLETAHILNNASAQSLIIIDELGRGTSTYDGLSIAWAVLAYLHDTVGAKTLFATHYHELIEVVEKMERAKNYSIAVAEHEGNVIFLHQVQEGGTPQSYGIEVAKLAGIPPPVIAKSQEILHKLEESHTGQLKIF